LIALSIGWLLIVSKTREAPPFANEKPFVPGPSDELLYEAAAKPEACHGRGVGVGEGVGDGAALGAAVGVADCAHAAVVPRAHAAIKAAMKVRKRTPIS
jgi:hypothetical protein